MRRMLVLAAVALAGCGEATAEHAPPAGPSGTLYLAGRDPGTLTRVDTATGHRDDAHRACASWAVATRRTSCTSPAGGW